MRILFALLALPLLAVPAQAQTTDTTPTGTTSKTAHVHHTMEQRFQQANVTHDGHLTEDQAKAGYKSVARHFSAIDQNKKGYVTEEDIRAYEKLRRTLHSQTTGAKHPSSS